MQNTTDTIAAISTAPGAAGIAIVRVSGPASFEVADRVVRSAGSPPSARPPRTLVHGYVHSPEAVSSVDEVIVLLYRAPHSYTREDVVEIQGHGGRASAARILRAVLAAGAKPAEPGEFTKRAFLNGRIDLVQAEAVMDLIEARSERAADAAVQQLEGLLSISLAESYECLCNTAADIEATLDFAEEELPAGTLTVLFERLAGVRRELEQMLDTWSEGHLLRDGALVVICGEPNVGKSTLLNELLRTNRSIVTSLPGTTRDTIEEELVLAGIPIRLVDTAGLRESDCEIEREGIERARSVIRRADVILYVMDASQPITETDRRSIRELGRGRVIVVFNKTDLGVVADAEGLEGIGTVFCSLARRDNVDGVRDGIVELLGVEESAPPHAVISERHRGHVQAARDEVAAAEELLAGGREDQVVPAAVRLRAALEELGAVTGREYTEELLDHVFGRFCIGK